MIQAFDAVNFSNRYRLRFAKQKRPSCLLLLFISTILWAAGHQQVRAQEVTKEEPPRSAQGAKPVLPSEPAPQERSSGNGDAVDDDPAKMPRATAMAQDKKPRKATLESDDPQTKHGDIYEASGDVVLTYEDHILRADKVIYNAATDEVAAEGHVRLTGGANDEDIRASHGTYNLRSEMGRFYDVAGSVELHEGERTREANPVIAALGTTGLGTLGMGTAGGSKPPSFQTSNPFLFRGRVVVKAGTNYEVYDGSVTSCLLPRPDWQLVSSKFTLKDGKAYAGNSTFKLLGVPILFLPYVTHPVDTEQRQSGLLIPVLGYSSASQNTGSKGFTTGEQFYLALGRSVDVTAGMVYYSLRGFGENGTFRYRGPGNDFLTAHFSSLQDRGFNAPSFDAKGNPITLYTNQSGQDVTLGLRRQLSPHIRAVGDTEYLSSYVYREAFTENFNQAVSSDIDSIVYVTHQSDGISLDLWADRYQGLKVVPVNNRPGQEVHIFHAPSIDFTGMDHQIPGTPLFWSAVASLAGLKRVQPNFTSSGIIERFDMRPEISLPLPFGGWHTLSSVAVRETAYTRSRKAPYKNGAVPVELVQGVNRASIELNVDIRPPVLEKTFDVPTNWQWLLGSEVRHAIEPDITYRNVHGIDNFLSILRFDDIDLASDTDELEYALTQHLYFKPGKKRAREQKPACPAVGSEAAEAITYDTAEQATNDANGIPDASATAPDQPTRTRLHGSPLKKDPCAEPIAAPKQQEWFSWKLSQKHFFAQNFGGAVIDQRRNIFDTTLSFSGIAFLTEPRSTSPLLSKMRMRTSSHTDIEWDFDYDTGAGKFNRSNTFLDVHEGKFFGGFSYARLNAPGRFYTEVINTTTNTATGLTSSAVSDFSQMRVLFGYGTPSKPGLAAAASAGIDLNLGSAQYITLQTSYNWNCCGLSVEYRKYDLGTVRNEGAYRFNFTLANIGTAGNLRRAESLF